MKPIETDELTIHYDVRQCIHARKCVLGHPKVFDTDARPWIQPEHGTADEIIPFELGRKLFAAAPGKIKQFVALDGLEHNAYQPGSYYDELARFLDRLEPPAGMGR